jgi:hypothetical protein
MVLPIPHARRDSPYEYNGYKNQYPAFTANANRDIGEKGLDEEVHGFASANNMVLPIPHARRDSPYEYNGFKNQYPAGFVANTNRDIGEGGIDEEVHGFASANNMVLPIPHARRDSPYEYNGFKNQYPASFTANRDIGEGGIDKEVQEFASSNNMVQPIPNARRDSAYEYNGFKNQYPAGFTATKDIGEGGIDEEVHGFASANNMVLGIPHARRDTPYEYNGFKNQYPAGFMGVAPKAKKVKDIGEKNIDEEVHGFVSANNMVEGTPLRRRQTAYEYNGSDPSAHPSDFVFKPIKLKDVGEKGIDEEVHGFVSANNMVEGTPLRSCQAAYDYNGGEAHPAPAFVGVRFMNNKKDIGDKKIDPEVWGLVNANNMVPPIQHARPKQPFLENGSDPSAQEAPELPGKFKYTQKHTKDIGETGIDEEVHGFASANNMVLPIPHARRQEPYNPNGYVGWPQGFAQQESKDIKQLY